jgi:hypothetical protein
MSTDRIVLPDCCEDWVLTYGAFYAVGVEFRCVECDAAWCKLGSGRFQSRRTSQIWSVRTRGAEDQQYRYLEAEDGHNPLTRRCCTKLILDYGDRIKLGRTFACPICGTPWRKQELEQRQHNPVVAYSDLDRGISVAVQQGAPRRFVVPFAEYQPWGVE